MVEVANQVNFQRRIALLGTPNTGKSSLFNTLTGLRQKTANYPGVTVEKKQGRFSLQDKYHVELIDLPGTYSLRARSLDEIITSEFIQGRYVGEAKPDLVLVVLNAAQLERGLYLLNQVQELGLPSVVALNMNDLAQNKGISVDCRRLEEILGSPVVGIHASKVQGIDQLRSTLFQAFESQALPAESPQLEYPKPLGDILNALAQNLNAIQKAQGEEVVSFRYQIGDAFRILADKKGNEERALVEALGESALSFVENARQRLVQEKVESLELIEARLRHAWAQEVVAQVQRQDLSSQKGISTRFDRVLTHPFWGMIIFFGVMGFLFQTIFEWSGPLMDLIDQGFGALGESVAQILPEGGWLQSLIVDGLIAGVGGVLIFLPQIVLLFLFIAFLEDSGYLARAAYLMDRPFRKVGLTGRSFIPMLSGFACAIPAIMATRTIPDKASRFATLMVVPLTSCSARLPVYILLIESFVPEYKILPFLGMQAFVMLCFYGLGLVVAFIGAFLIRKFFFRGAASHLMMELPDYTLPRIKSLFYTAYERGRVFVVDAGTIILAMSLIIWVLGYFPRSEEVLQTYEEKRAALILSEAELEEQAEKLEEKARGLQPQDPEILTIQNQQTDIEKELLKYREIDNQEAAALLENSFLGKAGKSVEPIFKPLGWDWRISTATIASFPAREVVIATLGTLFAMGEDQDETSEGLRDTLSKARGTDGKQLFTLATALSLMVFFALCMQCGASVSAIKRETNSWGMALLSFSTMTLLAYVGALIVYQLALVLGW